MCITSSYRTTQTQQRPSGRGTPPGFPHLRRLPLPFIEAPPGGPIYQPPRRSSPASAKIKHPSSSTAAKGSQQDGAGRPPAPRSNSVTGRKAARLDAKKRGRPSRVKWSTWIWHRQKWRGWPRLAPAPSAAGARPGRTITPKAGGWAVRPSKTPLRPPYAAGIRRPCAGAADLAGRARSILPVCL